MKKVPVRIAIIGPQGSGKGTQAALLSRSLRVPHISTGDIFRAHLKHRTALGKKVARLLDAGTLVPDSLVNAIVKDRLAKADCRRGFVLDGFPRTIAQARFLSKMFGGYFVVVLELSDREAVKRLSGRRMAPDGTIYHLKNNPPPKSLARKVVIRDDDRPVAVRRRLRQYRTLTAPLIRWYQSKGMLERIDGTLPIPTIARRISRVVSRRLKATP